MQTITLKVSDKVSDKFLWLLKHFSTDEIEMLDKTPHQNDNDTKSSFEPSQYYNVMNTSKSEIDSYLNSSREEWDNRLNEK